MAISYSHLEPGDEIAVGVTSVVKVNRHDNWIKLEIKSRKRSGETDNEAMARIREYVTEEFETTVRQLVDKILEMDE